MYDARPGENVNKSIVRTHPHPLCYLFVIKKDRIHRRVDLTLS